MSYQLPMVQPSAAKVLPTKKVPLFASNLEAALFWFAYGLKVIPILTGTKKATLSWDPWLENLSEAKIRAQWGRYPEHELGFIVGDDLIVFDADSPEAIAALDAIEKKHDVVPLLVVKTSKGVHHYNQLPKDAFAKSDSHDSKKHPARIDVKTGRNQIILPPSTGKTIEVFQANNVDELSEASQEFIDAVFKHNERKAPRVAQPGDVSAESSQPPSGNLSFLKFVLNHIDPDCGYDDWFKVNAAIFHETSGSDAGLALVIAWSSKSSKYPGDHVMREKWGSFKIDVSKPITIGTLIMMATASGMDLDAARDASIPPFEKITPPPVAVETSATSNLLDQYSLMGCSAELENQAVEQCFVLDEIALMGQMTFLFAPPNSGKTLLTFSFLIEAIKQGRINPSRVYYINVDDSAQGLLEKNRFAEEFGFNMLSEGHHSFSAANFPNLLKDLVEKDQASGVIIILDTVKNFVDVMDKTKCSRFTKAVRSFTLKGGTLIGLAHTNKNPGRNGKLVVGGTSDIRDDCDCAYTLSVGKSSAPDSAFVVFENIKGRGGVAKRAAYSYCTESGISYGEMLCSVRAVDESQFQPLAETGESASEATVIDAVKSCINLGVNSKMKLVDAVAQRIGVSKRIAIRVLEKYTGVDPAVHHWTYSVKGRGAKVFALLDPVSADS